MARSFSAFNCATSTFSPRSWRIKRSESVGFRGKLPTWVVGIRSFVAFIVAVSRQANRFLTTEFIQPNIFIDDAKIGDGKVSWRASHETLGGECQRQWFR